jgi:hypothetical protein
MQDINNLINYYGRNTLVAFRTALFDTLWNAKSQKAGNEESGAPNLEPFFILCD